jgi:hypothetical protein
MDITLTIKTKDGSILNLPVRQEVALGWIEALEQNLTASQTEAMGLLDHAQCRLKEGANLEELIDLATQAHKLFEGDVDVVSEARNLLGCCEVCGHEIDMCECETGDLEEVSNEDLAKPSKVKTDLIKKFKKKKRN